MEQIITSDIYFVAACLALGMEIKIPLDTSDPRHFRFTIFGDGIGLIKQEWMRGELIGNLCEFSRCVKNVKMILHEGKDEIRG
jgi:hypothetical protein